MLIKLPLVPCLYSSLLKVFLTLFSSMKPISNPRHRKLHRSSLSTITSILYTLIAFDNDVLDNAFHIRYTSGISVLIEITFSLT